MDVAAEYVLLGLRFDRIEQGFVEAYTGDLALRATVQDEPAPEPAELARRARELIAELPSSGLAEPRAAFLRAQLTGLECSARKLTGNDVGFVEEVAAYFQVDIEMGSEPDYLAAHDDIDALLRGPGSLAERYSHYRSSNECPPDQLETVVHVLSNALRNQVRTDYGLPDGETVQYDVVTDRPGSGFNYYLGNCRSRVAINADFPHRLTQLPQLVAHESYPGHHTEHCHKERSLVEHYQHVEHTIFLVNTPECLMAEGLADLGVLASVGPGWGRWAQGILADLGLRIDGDLAERMAAATAGLGRVRQDAALLLHDRGASQDEVSAYLRRWLLVPEERARQMLRFLSHPLRRAYTSTYVEGCRLLSEWLSARPANRPVAERFSRLLDEPLTPAAVRAELAT